MFVIIIFICMHMYYHACYNKSFSGDVVPLASTNEFGYRVSVTNVASDDGLNPTLLITLPQGVLLSRYVSIVLSMKH